MEEIIFTKHMGLKDTYYVDTTVHHVNPNHDAGYIKFCAKTKEFILSPNGDVDLSLKNLQTICNFITELNNGRSQKI